MVKRGRGKGLERVKEASGWKKENIDSRRSWGFQGKKEECVSAVESGNGIRSERTSTNLVLPGNHQLPDADFQKYYARLLRNEE